MKRVVGHRPTRTGGTTTRSLNCPEAGSLGPHCAEWRPL